MEYRVEAERGLAGGYTFPATYMTESVRWTEHGLLLTNYTYYTGGDSSKAIANTGSVFVPYGRVVRVVFGVPGDSAEGPSELTTSGGPQPEACRGCAE